MKTLPIPLVTAYLEALWIALRHGNTFASQARAMVEDVSHKEVVAGEFFASIDEAPADAFESYLKQTAHLILNQRDK